MAGFYDLALLANDTQRVSVQGNIVKVLAAPAGAVRVKLMPSGETFSLVEGTGVKLSRNGALFSDLIVTNGASAQSVILFVGDALDEKEFIDTRITGSVRIIDEITDRISTTVTTPSTAITAYNATQHIAPAANVNGIIVRGFACYADGGGANYALTKLVACKSLPTSFVLPAQKYLFGQAESPTGAGVLVTDNKLNKYLPPGWGLYAENQISTAVADAVSVQTSIEIL